MKEHLKRERVNIDGLARLVKNLKPYPEENYLKEDTESAYYAHYNSKEIDKSVDCLLLAKAWLGKCLEYTGEESPYKSGYRTKEDIEPTADVNFAPEMLAGYEEQTSHIEKVDYLRTEIQRLNNIPLMMDLATIADNLSPDDFLYNKHIVKLTRCKKKANEYLTEARFWLGFEISRIRESK